MKNFIKSLLRESLLEDNSNNIGYHVTRTVSIPTIKKFGITSGGAGGNFKNAKGKSFNTEGAVYSFTDIEDAKFWAMKMSLDNKVSPNSGNFSIVMFDKGGFDWYEDSNVAGLAKMLGDLGQTAEFTMNSIPPSNILDIISA
jgi:hypothetical protein